MESVQCQVYLSDVDEERFGIRTARASQVTLQTLPSIMDFCRDNHVMLLIARCATSELRAAQLMEREGFALMDTLVCYMRELAMMPIPDETGLIEVRAIRSNEEDKVKSVAAEAFRGYFGHYQADSRLNPARCDEVYVSWALRSCVSHEVADDVLVADQDGQIVGFATLRLNNANEGQGVLFGVAPSAQGQGVYRSLLIHSMQWCVSRKASRMLYETQITNIAVQKVLTRLGFEPSHAFYTFHKWFDR